MFYGGENNVPGAPGNVGAYQNMFAGLDLPIPGGRLNRGGDLRNQTRPGGQTETLPQDRCCPESLVKEPLILCLDRQWECLA
jgi:hypothetical protein